MQWDTEAFRKFREFKSVSAPLSPLEGKMSSRQDERNTFVFANPTGKNHYSSAKGGLNMYRGEGKTKGAERSALALMIRENRVPGMGRTRTDSKGQRNVAQGMVNARQGSGGNSRSALAYGIRMTRKPGGGTTVKNG